MTRQFTPGESAYIIISNLHIQKVTVVRATRDFAVVRFGETQTQLRTSRLYPDQESAQAGMRPRKRITHYQLAF